MHPTLQEARNGLVRQMLLISPKKANPVLYPSSEKCFHFSSTFIKSVAYSDFYESLQEV